MEIHKNPIVYSIVYQVWHIFPIHEIDRQMKRIKMKRHGDRSVSEFAKDIFLKKILKLFVPPSSFCCVLGGKDGFPNMCKNCDQSPRSLSQIKILLN